MRTAKQLLVCHQESGSGTLPSKELVEMRVQIYRYCLLCLLHFITLLAFLDYKFVYCQPEKIDLIHFLANGNQEWIFGSDGVQYFLISSLPVCSR